MHNTKRRKSGGSINNLNYEVVVRSIATVYCGYSCTRASMAFIRYAKVAEDDAVVCVQFCNGDQGIGRIMFYSGNYSNADCWNWRGHFPESGRP